MCATHAQIRRLISVVYKQNARQTTIESILHIFLSQKFAIMPTYFSNRHTCSTNQSADWLPPTCFQQVYMSNKRYTVCRASLKRYYTFLLKSKWIISQGHNNNNSNGNSSNSSSPPTAKLTSSSSLYIGSISNMVLLLIRCCAAPLTITQQQHHHHRPIVPSSHRRNVTVGKYDTYIRTLH